jgi:hypothetical protein
MVLGGDHGGRFRSYTSSACCPIYEEKAFSLPCADRNKLIDHLHPQYRGWGALREAASTSRIEALSCIILSTGEQTLGITPLADCQQLSIEVSMNSDHQLLLPIFDRKSRKMRFVHEAIELGRAG